MAASTLHDKRILLGITGGIAAYKAAELVRLLRQRGAVVRVVMTQAAQAFITPLTLQALSGYPVHTNLLGPEAEAGMGHIELARWAELLVVAPASADFIARLAVGQADDLLATVCLATTAPIALAPAMNQAMWRNQATRHNCQILERREIATWGPAEGEQACGDTGPGRMLEPAQIADHVAEHFAVGYLSGKTVVVTAGPTREPLDPVRFISNHSSGKMGYALARAAQQAGARVFLVSGPTALAPPAGVVIQQVETAEQMLAQCLDVCAHADIFISAAAVADYRAAAVSAQKIKKDEREQIQLTLVKNPDIVATIAAGAHRPFMVGFAAETENVIENAQTKLLRKNLDVVIANDVAQPGIGFNSDRNAVWLVHSGGVQAYAEAGKQQLAKALMRDLARLYERHNSKTS